jgi:L-malate glycosyltransferase
MKRILHLIHTPRVSGAEMLVESLCRVHARDGIACGIASLEPSEMGFVGALEQLTAIGVKKYVPDERPGRIGRIRNYASAIADFRPDLIYGHSALPSIYGRIATAFVNSSAAFITVLHSGSPDYDKLSLRVAERQLLTRSSLVFSVGRRGADDYRRRFPKCPPVRVVPNGIDVEAFRVHSTSIASARERLGMEAGQRVVVQIGRVCAIKRQAESLAATAPLLREDPCLQLWFAGIVEIESYKRQVEAQAEAFGIARQVAFLGPRSDVHDLLAASAVFLMPSEAEAQGIAMLEALASGICVVASDIEAFAPFRQMPGVRLVDPSKREEFTELIAAGLAGNVRFPDRRLGEFDIRRTAAIYGDPFDADTALLQAR